MTQNKIPERSLWRLEVGGQVTRDIDILAGIK